MATFSTTAAHLEISATYFPTEDYELAGGYSFTTDAKIQICLDGAEPHRSCAVYHLPLEAGIEFCDKHNVAIDNDPRKPQEADNAN